MAGIEVAQGSCAGQEHVHVFDFAIKDEDGNFAVCKSCKENGHIHEIREVSHGFTDGTTGCESGIPTTRIECSKCLKWAGPFVNTELIKFI